MQKRGIKLIAIMVIFIFTFSYITILAEFAGEVQAASKELLEQTSKTNQANVEFNVHLGEEKHENEYYIGEDNQLYLKINVTDGYLKNAQVEFTDANFNIQTEKVADEHIQEAQSNKILFRELASGTQTEIAVPIAISNQEVVEANYFAKETKAIFTATYVKTDGKEKKVEKEILNQINWKAQNLEVEASQNISKYVPYKTEKQKGIVLQTIVKSGIVENKIAIAQTQIEIKAPKIANQVPTRVIVTANSTIASNASKTGIEFGKENYSYDESTGIIQINNKNKENEIAWAKGQDEYVVTMVYESEKAYEQVGTNQEIIIEGKVNITPYNEEQVEKDISGKVVLTQQIEELANASMEVPENISKAYIYANYNKKENKKETPYHITYKIGSVDLNLVDKMQIALENGNYLQEQEGEILQNIVGLSTIKSISVDKEMFNTYLGEEGKIEIYQNGQVVGSIEKKELQEGEEEPASYSFDCANLETTEGLSLQTSTLQKEGNLYIEVEKAIKTEIGIEKETIKALNKLEETIEIINQKEEIADKENIAQRKAQSNLTEVESKAQLQISTQNLSTVVTNQNIEIKAILESDSLDCGLYKNPTIKIAMPSQVEKVEIQSAELLFTGELENLQATYNPETKNIEISMEGTQTEYNIGSMIQGPTVRIVANITTKTFIPSSQESISMVVSNQEDNATIKAELPVNIIAPTGLVTINEMQGYSNQETAVQSVTGSQNVGTLEVYDEAKTATIKGTIINNLQADAKNVKILGRVPFEGNKKIDSEEALGTNLTTNMASQITVEGIEATTYYSENENANKDLEDANNQWTTTPEDLSKVKSYLIVANEGNVAKASTLDFQYQVIVPENLPHNKEAYTTFKAYYDNQTEVGTMAESAEAPVVGVSTQAGPELAASLSANVENNGNVTVGQYVRFAVEVKNTGDVNAKNVKVKITNPEGTDFVTFDETQGGYKSDFETEIIETPGSDYDQDFSPPVNNIHEKVIDIGDLEKGKSTTVEYELYIGEILEEVIPGEHEGDDKVNEKTEVINTATITADELEKGIQTENYTLHKQKGYVNVININGVDEDYPQIAGRLIKGRYIISNSNSEDAENVIFKFNIPEDCTIQEVYILDENDTKITNGLNISEKQVTMNIGTIEKGTVKNIYVISKIGMNTPERIATTATVEASGTEHLSNVRYIKVGKVKLEATQLQPEDRYIKEGKNFVLNYNITNTGEVDAKNVMVEIPLVDGLTPEVDVIQGDKIIRKISSIQAGETLKVSIPVKMSLKAEEEDGKEIQTSASVYADGFDKIETNKVTYIIEYVKIIHDNTAEPDDSDENGTYKISGRVWLDSNINGQREEDEQTIGNVQILLLDKATNAIVKDQTSMQEKIITTDSTGRYTFSNLTPGEYLVAFLYDSANYDITAYQKEGVPSSSNSDGIAMNITYNGEQTRGAVTNTITITNANARDIDLGLITAQSFDLRLDKYITKVTRVNSAETKTYTYDNKQIAKIDTLRKRLNESNVIVEYKLVVTNEGAIPGYAKKIVDYLPKDLKFSSELNTQWYAGTDGNIYSNKLANEEIKPGESKEITLVLTKQMSENNLGNSRNTAEIYETYNVLGKEDVDSTPGNKAQNEDDISSADLVLSIVTGKVATYTGIVIASIAIIAFGAYEVKKHVLDKIAKI